MKLQNPFSDETRMLFMDVWKCGECGQNGTQTGGLELHHIYGRVSDSPFNAIVLCKECHGHVGHSLKEHVKFARLTMEHLREQFYRIKDTDESFLRDFIAKDFIRDTNLRGQYA